MVGDSILLFLKVVGDGIGFTRELFSNMKESLFHDKVVSSQSESIAVMTAFMECLRYILFNFHQDTNVRDETTGSIAEEEDGHLIEYLINREVKIVSFSIPSLFEELFSVRINQFAN